MVLGTVAVIVALPPDARLVTKVVGCVVGGGSVDCCDAATINKVGNGGAAIKQKKSLFMPHQPTRADSIKTYH